MIYDISQSIFGCDVYPGDPKPEKVCLSSLDNKDFYNLSSFSMCAHNGTHIDAPSHFLKNGKTVDQIILEKCVGLAFVYSFNGDLNKDDAISIIEKAREFNNGADKRILIKGKATITLEAAKEFAKAEIYLIGNESQSVGPIDKPMEVHLALLENDIVLLEGIRLEDVDDGDYILNCAPIKLNGLEGAPCRAILIK